MKNKETTLDTKGRFPTETNCVNMAYSFFQRKEVREKYQGSKKGNGIFSGLCPRSLKNNKMYTKVSWLPGSTFSISLPNLCGQ
jgi:hypothetical protein